MDETARARKLQGYRARRRAKSWKREGRSRADFLTEGVVVLMGAGVVWLLGDPSKIDAWMDLVLPAVGGFGALLVWEIVLRPAKNYVWTVPEEEHLDVCEQLEESRHQMEIDRASLNLQIDELTAAQDEEARECILELGGITLTEHKETGRITVFLTDMVLTNPSVTRAAIELWLEISNSESWTTSTTAEDRVPPDVTLAADYIGRIVNIDGRSALSGFSAFVLAPTWITQAGAPDVQAFLDRVPLYVVVKDKITGREKKVPAPGTVRKEHERRHQGASNQRSSGR